MLVLNSWSWSCGFEDFALVRIAGVTAQCPAVSRCGSGDVIQLEQALNSLVDERQELIQQRDSKLKQVTHLAEMVADLKLQLESMAQQDHYKTRRYGIYSPSYDASRTLFIISTCLQFASRQFLNNS